MSKRGPDHKYLLYIYSRVNQFLNNEDINKNELPDAIVSFCIAVEKILKIKLHKKNPFLIFDTAWINTDDKVSMVALKKEERIETIKIKTVINRFKVVFKKIFTPDELQALNDIYNVRNFFVHGHKPDYKIDYDEIDIVKKMGTIWGKVSKIAVSLLGKEHIKNSAPKKKYTEKELEKVLEEEVKKMIDSSGHNPYPFLSTEDNSSLSMLTHLGDTQCPRCKSYTFSRDDNRDPLSLSAHAYSSLIDEAYHGLYDERRSRLYKCRRCHLELTEKQYEIAKNLNDKKSYGDL